MTRVEIEAGMIALPREARKIKMLLVIDILNGNHIDRRDEPVLPRRVDKTIKEIARPLQSKPGGRWRGAIPPEWNSTCRGGQRLLH
jgi:hypothetical protein